MGGDGKAKKSHEGADNPRNITRNFASIVDMRRFARAVFLDSFQYMII